MCTKDRINKPILGILLGEATGVGPEIVAKVAAKGFFNDKFYPVIIGDLRVLKMGMKIAKVEFPYAVIENVKEADWNKGIPVLDQKNLDPEEITLGEVNLHSGKVTGDTLITAVNLCRENQIDGFCYGPLNKTALKKGGHNFNSENELFVKHFNCNNPCAEMNIVDNLWTSRVTSHIPLKEICNHLSEELIIESVKLADETVKRAGIESPRIALSALNPHGGENGLCGSEEIDIIMPAIKEMQNQGINISGMYPADILFIKAFDGECDIAVTMYHDQGQIAMKLKGFEHGVTVQAGFPAAITTPAHGSAFDIAGKGIANTGAFESAVEMAVKIAKYDNKSKLNK